MPPRPQVTLVVVDVASASDVLWVRDHLSLRVARPTPKPSIKLDKVLDEAPGRCITHSREKGNTYQLLDAASVQIYTRDTCSYDKKARMFLLLVNKYVNISIWTKVRHFVLSIFHNIMIEINFCFRWPEYFYIAMAKEMCRYQTTAKHE